jgi:hypothetical protein
VTVLDWIALLGGLLGWVTFGWLLIDRRRNRPEELPALASIRLDELRPLRWAILDEAGRRWLLVQSEYRRDDTGGTMTLILRDEATLRQTERFEA